MSTLKRSAAAVAAPLLLAVSLSACGGSDSAGGDAPKSASQADFCGAITANAEGLSSDDTGTAVDAAHAEADKLASVGTPSDMSDDQRTGFEKFVGFLKGVSSSDVEDLKNQGDQSDDEAMQKVFGDDATKVQAFLTYVTEKCTPSASDLPSLDPSDLPSDLGSDLPTDLSS